LKRGAFGVKMDCATYQLLKAKNTGEEMQQKVLVIDDDRELVQMLKTMLEKRNHQVAVACSGREGLRKAYKTRPDVVILDIMMPGMDGWEVCRRLRELSNVPIIMLTARAGQNDVVHGLSIGADDYLTKPFSTEELEARIQAVLRRSNKAHHNLTKASVYSNGHLSIDFDRRIVKVSGKKVDLTPIEFRLLSCMVHNEGRVLPHQYLLNEVWGPGHAGEIDYVKHYIRYLRHKIEKDPSNPVYILTEWGVGYRLAEV
jgi:DNA-binding response OmpR family regulator